MEDQAPKFTTEAQKWKWLYLRSAGEEHPHEVNHAFDEWLNRLSELAKHQYQDQSTDNMIAEYESYDRSLFVFEDGSAVYIRMGQDGNFANADLPADPPVFTGLEALL